MKVLCICLTAALALCSGGTDYLPIAEGNQWSYVGLGGTLDVRVLGWYLTTADGTPANGMVACWRGAGRAETLAVTTAEDCVAASSLDRMDIDEPYLPLLKLPLQLDSFWSITDVDIRLTSEDDLTLKATCRGFKDISVPAGTFEQCAKVEYELGDRRYYVWFAPGVGPVKLALDTAYGSGREVNSRFAPELKLQSFKLSDKPTEPLSESVLAVLTKAGKIRRVSEAMNRFQSALEFHNARKNCYPTDMMLSGGGAFLSGSSDGKALGTYPVNPFTGKTYRLGTDMFFFPDTLRDPTSVDRKGAGAPDSPFDGLKAPGGVPGTIVILGHTPRGMATPTLTRYAIVGFGDRIVRPLDLTDLGKEQESYYVLHN